MTKENTKKKKVKKLYASFASYVMEDNSLECDLDEMAKHLAKSIGNVPEHINDKRACEINLLARAYLILSKSSNKQ